MHRLDGKSLPLQHGPERVRKQDRVFNDQNFHIIIPQVQIAGKWYGGIQREALCASYPYQLYSFFYRFSRKTAEKIVSRPNGRETGKMYAYAFSLCEAVKRFRMAANWQRVAVPVGRSLPSVPLMRPWPTAHCMAGTA